MTYTLDYDELHRRESKTDERLGRSLVYEYDPVGNLERKTDYQGDLTEFQYDGSDRLVAMRNPAYL